MASKLWLGLLLVSLSFAAITEEEDVWVLDESNFQEALDAQPDILVEFYAPWCGHCKKLAPEYAKAAKTLKGKNPPIRIAKVDATASSNLASQYGVSGYPTLKYFINKKPTEYSGGRTEDTIVSWIMKRAGPALTIVDTVADLKKQLGSAKVAGVLFAQKDAAEVSIFEAVAKSFDGPSFFVSTDAAALQEYGVTEPKVILFKQFDDKEVKYDGALTQTDITKWVEENKKPWVMPFDDAAIEYIFQKQNPCVFLFRSESDAPKYADAMSKLGKELKQDIAFSFADLNQSENKRLGDYLGIYVKDMPIVVLIDHKGGLNKYKLAEAPSEESIRTLVQDWKARKLTPFLKSEPIPSDDFDGSVRVLVGKNFESVVYDSTKDVLVEFYAPWCGHCKSLAPEYEKLAAAVKDNSNLIIAKVDATANEVKGINIQGFPTLKWFPSNNKRPVDYEGERNFDGLLKFVTDKATVKAPEKAQERADL
ncbi:unnamed protein product [Blepharisma stoltei]|uniref:Protein disulfide-isomerase n=1 Tax=Blepharisma stoltei TaxID=1481888 RepID=A0AAU9J4R0_9CILI|nr:unnamed protein product [Blepharisma stoltei]